MVYTMIVNEVSATILLAIILGVLITGKIDNWAHVLGFVSIILMLILFGIELLILPMIILVIAGMSDEIGNDFIDRNRQIIIRKMFGNILIKFFDQRWVLKIVILGFVLASIFPWYFFFSMLLFDYAYLTITLFSQYKQGIITTSIIRKSIPLIGLIFR
jgi:hypothetical protein